MTPRSWFLEETAHAGRDHLDPAWVRGYDHKAGFDPWPSLELLLTHGMDEQATLVDLGCGTGTFALAAAAHCRRVIAVDVSPAMIAEVAAKVERSGVGNVETVLAGFLSYEHQGEPADVVHSRNALHQLPDLWKAVALTRIAALLRPGGMLHLSDLVFAFDPHELERHVEPWLAGAGEDPQRGWTREEYETHLREEYSIFSWILEPMLQRTGFEIRETAYRDSRIYATYLCVRNG